MNIPTQSTKQKAMQRVQRDIGILAFIVAGFMMTASAWAASRADIEAAVRTVDGLANQLDVEGLQKVHEQLKGFNSEPNENSLYALAYCRYRLASMQMDSPGDGAKEVLKSAQKDLEALLEIVPKKSSKTAEAMSLLSGVMGMRIGLDEALGMRLGAQSGRHLAKAEALAPENPRVFLQDGISKYNTPKMWGGSLPKAEVALRKAVAIFAGQPSDAPWPNWGYMDALAWLGQALADQGKIDEARAVYQQALAIDPEVGWIRHELLPALDSTNK